MKITTLTDTVKALMTAYEGLLNNPKYPTPPVDLAIYKAGIDQYSALIIDAADGGKKAKSAMDKQRGVVIKMYAQPDTTSRRRVTTIWQLSTPAALRSRSRQRLRRGR